MVLLHNVAKKNPESLLSSILKLMCLFIEKYSTILKKVQLILPLCSTPKISPEIPYKQMDETDLLARYGNDSCLFYLRHKAFLEPSPPLLMNGTKRTTSVASAFTPISLLSNSTCGTRRWAQSLPDKRLLYGLYVKIRIILTYSAFVGIN